MSVDLVTFNIRYEKSQLEFKMKSPSDVFHFIKTLKTELKIDDTVDIIILCPTSEGKMKEIKSNDDIAFLKKTKLSFNPESKEIYCSAELVLSVIYKQLPDDPKVQMMVLSNKIDQLTYQFEKLSQSLEHKIDENTNTLQNNIKLILAEHLSTNSGKTEDTNSDNTSQKKSGNTAETNSTGEKQKNPKMNKKKLSSTSSHDISTFDDNLSKSYENINLEKKPVATNKKPTDIDSLLEMLAEDGFTNTIQNIIVLKRFDNDYEKVVEYLNNST